MTVSTRDYEYEYDVVVLGAGPCGCATALAARHAGLRVHVVETARRPRRAPGETLHPGLEALFARLGVLRPILACGFPRHRGIWVVEGAERRFVAYGEDKNGPWLGFHADRLALQRVLQQAAVDSGCTLQRGSRPTQVLEEHGRLCGVVVEGRTMRARWTVDATGRHSWLGQSLGLECFPRSPPMRANFGWRDVVDDGHPAEPVFALHQDGWRWTALVAEKRAAWVELGVGEARSGIDQTWSRRPRCAGPGYFLGGDAVGTLDPSASSGVLRAVMSGMLIGHMCAAVTRGGVDEVDAARVYREHQNGYLDSTERQLRRRLHASSFGQRLISEGWPATGGEDLGGGRVA